MTSASWSMVWGVRTRVAPVGHGLAASPGAAAGQIVFTADDVVEWVDKGHKVILVRRSP